MLPRIKGATAYLMTSSRNRSAGINRAVMVVLDFVKAFNQLVSIGVRSNTWQAMEFKWDLS